MNSNQIAANSKRRRALRKMLYLRNGVAFFAMMLKLEFCVCFSKQQPDVALGSPAQGCAVRSGD
jgi:hypothetical protein